ncbi:MAG: shikimate dehydrogenase [Deltaproteobacteria bacterium]|nr:MAG: shikimate dehydrogenase [Deltaproteobacteria bacterium]
MKTSNKLKNTPKISLLGIIGDPIKHSLSPAMHNAALEKLALPYAYLPFQVSSKELKSFFLKAKKWNLVGFNVTIPHKEAVLLFLKKISPEAKLMGAVNTIYQKKGVWYGDNTDGRGYLTSLSTETKFHPRGKRIVILGAGGAARAVICSLALKSPRAIILLNRTEEKASALAQEFSNKFKKIHFEALPLEKESCQIVFPDTHLLINTTSIGLNGTHFDKLPLKHLPKTAIVSDLVYRPLKTKLLKQAEKLGLKIHPGIGMLLHQGALAFKLWTHHQPPLKIMQKALLDAL